ncbi:MAG: hypothetical protein QOI81_1528 [Actinomycetota bacterium]|jgi:amicyanin|nr:hypothetical protein [Actinomycetota bacterium]
MPNLTADRLALASVAVGALLLLSACGSPAVPAAQATPPMRMVMTTSSPGKPVASSAVGIMNFAFQPAIVTVHIGTTVTWTNKDTIPHTVSDPQGGISSPTLSQNATYGHTFTKVGTYDYICTIHPYMHGTVVVTR